MIRNKLRKLKLLYKKITDSNKLKKKSDSELFSLLRHEAHRIEKSHYNNIFDDNYDIYKNKKDIVSKIICILSSRKKYYSDDPCILWAKKIIDNFDNFLNGFIKKNSSHDYERSISYENLLKLQKNRRSCRVWSDEQPSKEMLNEIAIKLIESAITAPNSGNRQGWRFKIITEEYQRFLFKGIKEKHTYMAPLLIYISIDKRLYFAYGKNETSFYVDAGAAIQNMVTAAQTLGLDTCWNHFSSEFINSRSKNEKIYKEIVVKLNIEEHIEPVAILAVGKSDFIPPEPKRMNIDEFII